MIGCVILTMGDRPTELASAVASVRAQRGVDVDIVVVVNGAEGHVDVTDARSLRLEHNVGIPGGRNAGLAEVSGDLVLFLDDDAELGDPDLLRRAQTLFDERSDIGIVSMRLVDPEGRTPQRRHVPRVRVGDASRSSEVTTFLGGASVVRRAVFRDAGPFAESFFYAHEELDLAWRAIDAGWRVWYAGDLVVHHPAVEATRHRTYHRLTMRNRVLLARRRLPWPLAAVHVLSWVVISAVRRELTADSWKGLVEGLRSRDVERRPIRWRTVWLLARLGRPPIV